MVVSCFEIILQKLFWNKQKLLRNYLNMGSFYKCLWKKEKKNTRFKIVGRVQPHPLPEKENTGCIQYLIEEKKRRNPPPPTEHSM